MFHAAMRLYPTSGMQKDVYVRGMPFPYDQAEWWDVQVREGGSIYLMRSKVAASE